MKHIAYFMYMVLSSIIVLMLAWEAYMEAVYNRESKEDGLILILMILGTNAILQEVRNNKN